MGGREQALKLLEIRRRRFFFVECVLKNVWRAFRKKTHFSLRLFVFVCVRANVYAFWPVALLVMAC